MLGYWGTSPWQTQRPRTRPNNSPPPPPSDLSERPYTAGGGAVPPPPGPPPPLPMFGAGEKGSIDRHHKSVVLNSGAKGAENIFEH